jgi:DNA-binding transcriptional regulator PaaX
MNENVFSRPSLVAHILRSMNLAQREGRSIDLEGLTAELGARRGDVRAALSAMHRQGLLDVTRMRLTLTGFAVGASLAGRPLAPLRSARRAKAA